MPVRDLGCPTTHPTPTPTTPTSPFPGLPRAKAWAQNINKFGILHRFHPNCQSTCHGGFAFFVTSFQGGKVKDSGLESS